MKTITLIVSLGLFPCMVSLAEVDEPTPQLVDAAELSSYVIPITEKAAEAFRLILIRDGCSLTDYLQRCGVFFPDGSKSSLDSDKNLVHITLDHKSASKVVMLLGSVIAVLTKESLTPEQFAIENSGVPEGYSATGESNTNKKEKSEMATPRKPSD